MKNTAEIDGRRYRMTFDYHTHTTFSHGKGSMEDNVKAALEKGLKGIAISDHGPGHVFYGVKRGDLAIMRGEADRLNKLYPDIDIYLSVEANVLKKAPYLDLTEEEKEIFDFVIAGYHYGVFNGNCFRNGMYKTGLVPAGAAKKLMKANTEMTVRCLYENDIRILTHPGDKAAFDMRELAKACEDNGTWMEISTWHDHLTGEEIRICAGYDVKFVVSSDAHTSDRVGSFENGVLRALHAGLDIERIVNIEEIDEEG